MAEKQVMVKISNETSGQMNNYAAQIIFRNGSKKEHLQRLSEQIFETGHSLHINVSAKWIPRNLLTEVDALTLSETSLFRFLVAIVHLSSLCLCVSPPSFPILL